MTLTNGRLDKERVEYLLKKRSSSGKLSPVPTKEPSSSPREQYSEDSPKRHRSGSSGRRHRHSTDEEREAAATKVAASQRGRRARHERKASINSATKMQAATRGHLARHNTAKLRVDMPALVERLLAAPTQPTTLVAWDFDKTVLRIHAFGRGVRVEEVAERWERDVADLDFFRAMVKAAKAIGARVGIASFGRREVVLEYMRHIFSDEPDCFTAENVLTPGALPGHHDGSDVPNGKPLLLDLLCALSPQVTDKSSVLYFDDDVKNIYDCHAVAFPHAYHTPDAFGRVSLNAIADKLLPKPAVVAVPDVAPAPAPTPALAQASATAAAAAFYSSRKTPTAMEAPPPDQISKASSSSWDAPREQYQLHEKHVQGRRIFRVGSRSVRRRPQNGACVSPCAWPPRSRTSSHPDCTGPTYRYKTMMRGGHDANGAGDFARARQCFLDAYAASPTAVARISAANMALKTGDHSTARAEYDEILRDTSLSEANRAVREACACGVRDVLACLSAVGLGKAGLCGVVPMCASRLGRWRCASLLRRCLPTAPRWRRLRPRRRRRRRRRPRPKRSRRPTKRRRRHSSRRSSLRSKPPCRRRAACHAAPVGRRCRRAAAARRR